MRHLAPLLLVLLAPLTATAEDPACERIVAPVTAMQSGALGRATHVLLGEVVHVRDTRGMLLARVKPLAWVKGEATDAASISVMVRGPRPTGERDRPSAAYLRAGDTGRHVFFLQRDREGVAFGLLTMFDAGGELGAQKWAALQRHAELAKEWDPALRTRDTMAWLLASQKARGTWTRVHTARELNRLALDRPDLFDDTIRTALKRHVGRGALPAQRRWLELTIHALDGTTAVPHGSGEGPTAVHGLAAELEGVRPDERRIEVVRSFLHRGGAFSEVLAALPQESAEVRLWVVTTLADGGYRSALPKIRSLYAREEDVRVLGAIVRSVGLLGGAVDVPWLVERLGSLSLRRDALFALARIRTPEALDALERVADEVAEDGAATGDIGPLVEYLRSAVFVDVEAADGRRVGADRAP